MAELMRHNRFNFIVRKRIEKRISQNDALCLSKTCKSGVCLFCCFAQIQGIHIFNLEVEPPCQGFYFCLKGLIGNGTVFIKKRNDQDRKQLAEHKAKERITRPPQKPPKRACMPNQGVQSKHEKGANPKGKDLFLRPFPKP